MEAKKQRESYTKKPEDFEKAKEIAIKLMPILDKEANGHFLISLEVLDLLTDAIQQQAIKLKLQFEKEKQLNLLGGKND